MLKKRNLETRMCATLPNSGRFGVSSMARVRFFGSSGFQLCLGLVPILAEKLRRFPQFSTEVVAKSEC
jgi:hypothetical protein